MIVNRKISCLWKSSLLWKSANRITGSVVHYNSARRARFGKGESCDPVEAAGAAADVAAEAAKRGDIPRLSGI